MAELSAIPRPVSEVLSSQMGIALGDTYKENGKTYIFVKGVASTVTGDWLVFYPNTFTTARMTKAEVDKLYPLGIALGALVANTYGWIQIQGLASAKLLASCAVEVPLYTSATAGNADDDSTTQTKINRVVNLTVVGGAAAVSPVWIDRPSAS